MDLLEEILGPEWVAEPLPPPSPGEEEAIRARTAQLERPDRVQGMLLGVGLGDALGGPHEFRNQVPLSEYTGELVHPLTLFRRFQGGMRHGSIGQITDDTEMTIVLAESIVANRGEYSRERAVRGYLAWVNSGCYFLGNNTRALMHGIKTAAGYESRHAAIFGMPQDTWSQSNGCLMRCSPLATLPAHGWLEAAVADCRVTNPHPTCIFAVVAHLAAIRALLFSASPADATTRAIEEITRLNDTLNARESLDAVLAIIEGARRLRPRVVADHQKGWSMHALHCSFFALHSPEPTFAARIDAIVRMGGDTDTNGAIAGAMLGALFGARRMRAENATRRNIESMLAVDPTAGELGRPRCYGAWRLVALAEALADVG